MKLSPIRLGGQLAALAALPFLSTQVLADAESLRADGLGALLNAGIPAWDDKGLVQVADIARFYDDGLSRPQGALLDQATLPWSATFQVADIDRFYDDGLSRPQVMLLSQTTFPSSEEVEIADIVQFYDDGLEQVDATENRTKEITPNVFVELVSTNINWRIVVE